MKAVVILAEGEAQIALMPDTGFESTLLGGIYPMELSGRYRGDIGNCEGGWIRVYPATNGLILRFRDVPKDSK